MITVLADPNLPDLRACLHASVRIVNYDLDRGWTPEELASADALLVRTTHKVNRTTLPPGSRVRFVGTASAGRDHIDAQWLAESGIALADAAGSNAQSVAEYVASAMIWWSEKRGESLSGLRVGIVGCGHTGSAVAHVLGRLGCVCVLYDPPREERERVDGAGDAGLAQEKHGAPGPGAARVSHRAADVEGPGCFGDVAGADDAPFRSATLEDVLACEVLTLHVPLEFDGPWATWHWLDARKLGLAGAGGGVEAGAGAGAEAAGSDEAGLGASSAGAPGIDFTRSGRPGDDIRAKKLVINASRGGVVDEQALREAAQTGLVTDFVCDVWEGEPQFDDRTVARALLATPHIAGYSLEAKHAATVMLVQALHHWLGLPAPRVPVPQPAQTSLEGDVDTVGQVLEQVHPGPGADRELRALAGLDAQAKAAGFHALRHRTRMRREFAYLRLPAAVFDRMPELKALGFAGDKMTREGDPNPIHPRL